MVCMWYCSFWSEGSRPLRDLGDLGSIVDQILKCVFCNAMVMRRSGGGGKKERVSV